MICRSRISLSSRAGGTLILAMAAACALIAAPAAAGEYAAPFDEMSLADMLAPYERIEYAGLRYLLNDHQKMEYLTLPSVEDREDWCRRFWKLNDPSPTTPRNERKIEHDRRVRDALALYFKAGFPGWDHRGEVLIRFGEPDLKTNVLPSMTSAESVQEDFKITMPGQVWHYKALGMVVPFQKVTGSGEYVYYLDLSTIGSREMTEMTRRATRMGGGPAALMTTSYYCYLLDARTYSSSNIYDMKFAATPDLLRFYSFLEDNIHIHTADLDADRIDCYFDLTAFKGGPGRVRAEISLEIPSAMAGSPESAGGLAADLEISVAAFDMMMNEVASGSDTVRMEISGQTHPDGSWLIPAQYIMALEPGYYRFGLEVRDRSSGKHASYLFSRQIPSIHDSLCLSDIQMASSITPDSGATSFRKGALRVIPHPLHAYRKPGPVRLYFEIYGLDVDDGGIGLYEIDYVIEPQGRKRKGPAFSETDMITSSTAQTSGYGSDQQAYLEIESGGLREGIYHLMVRVMDRRTRKHVETMTSFSILDK